MLFYYIININYLPNLINKIYQQSFFQDEPNLVIVDAVNLKFDT